MQCLVAARFVELKVFSLLHRLNLENCEDDLVQKTEVAITLMKTVLDNVGPSALPDA